MGVHFMTVGRMSIAQNLGVCIHPEGDTTLSSAWRYYQLNLSCVRTPGLIRKLGKVGKLGTLS